MATARIGVVLVNINPAYRQRELAFALERSEVQGLFLIPEFRSSNYVAMLQELIPELTQGPAENLHSSAFPLLRTVVIYDPADPMQTSRPSPGYTNWQEVMSAEALLAPDELEQAGEALDRDDPINIQYTSGTTGFPKAVVLTHCRGNIAHSKIPGHIRFVRAFPMTVTGKLQKVPHEGNGDYGWGGRRLISSGILGYFEWKRSNESLVRTGMGAFSARRRYRRARQRSHTVAGFRTGCVGDDSGNHGAR